MAEVKTLPEKLVDEIAVSIDGQQFFVRNPDAMPVLDYVRIEIGIGRFGALLIKDAVTDEERDEASRIVAWVSRAVLAAPETEHAKLSDQQRYQILDFFWQRLQQQRGKRKTQEAPAKAPTGESSSPDSQGSTEAIPSAG